MLNGRWITSRKLHGNMHVIFEEQFELAKFSSAKIKITADDYYKLYINGTFVGQGPAPAYSAEYRFNEYDITSLLHTGKNAVRVHCYYQGLTNRVWVSGDGVFGMLADIVVDGAPLCCTGGDWQYREDLSFLGGDSFGYDTSYPENRDLRIALTEPENAVEAPCPHNILPEAFPSLEVYEIRPTLTKSGNRCYCDLGQEYVCTPVIEAFSQNEGAAIILHCAEELNTDGSLRHSLRCGCNYEERITLKNGTNTAEQFDCKALRYIEIICDDGVKITGLRLRVQHYPFTQKTQEVYTKNERLSAVWRLCKNTLKLGVQESFIDCPTRERGQYLGDTYISGFAHYYLTNDCRLLKKALCDFARSADYCEEILAVAPCAYRQRIADYSLLFASALYKYFYLTGDAELAESLLAVCDKINGYYSAFENSCGLLQDTEGSWNLVDWPDNMRDGYQYNLTDGGEHGFHNVLNASYIHSLKCTEALKTALGIAFEPQAQKKAAAFNRVFFDKKAGLYADCEGSTHHALHSNILPLAFDICEEKNACRIADYLEARGMACSVYMSYFYLNALCKAGRKQAVLGFITSDGKNSWLNMLKEGATVTFEAWGKDRKWNTSLFHPWATAPILIINEHFPDMLSPYS